MSEINITRFAIYYLYYKKEFQITNTLYDLCFYHNSDKLRTIISIYQLKISFIPSYTTQIVKFLLDNQVLSNK